MKHLFATVLILLSMLGRSQNAYWVLFTDKNNVEFDPYSYFDAKAIDRYEKCGADLYDISNYPVNGEYEKAVAEYADEVVGCSRWHNAVGIMASTENARLIAQFPFVKGVLEIVPSENSVCGSTDLVKDDKEVIDNNLFDEQTLRFGASAFYKSGINGKGLRIAVLDGGFPSVDTHPAFKHLRDENRIIATYNFPNMREDVYGWNSHGTMVLSCITGIYEGKMMGLATGSEFLLARTEIEAEPFKEEIWWQMGMEWADKNGADIINSSLGYGKQRYYTKDMDGTSYVARAANMAAAKGILVCCSAGNEGDDKQWRTLVTPSDADSVICVGGIEARSKNRHIYFSSYGPTADGRQKPDVVAFGEAVVAKPSGGITTAYGTSFSSPLTAGFCACAWQMRREFNAMQMKAEIIKSCDLYPYHDYALGYGVPQATYFTGESIPQKRLFHLTTDNSAVIVHFCDDSTYRKYYGIEPEQLYDVFVSISDENGVLGGYHQFARENDSVVRLGLAKLGSGNKVTVSYAGFCDSIMIQNRLETDYDDFTNDTYMSRSETFYKAKNEKIRHCLFTGIDGFLRNGTWNGSNTHWSFGYRFLYGGKHYMIGASLSGDLTKYRSDILETPTEQSDLDVKETKSQLRTFQSRIAIVQRIKIIPDFLFIDIEAYGGLALSRTTKVTKKYILSPTSDEQTVKETHHKSKSLNQFQYGVTARIGTSYDGKIGIALCGSYRISSALAKNQKDFLLGDIPAQPSPWSIGVEVEFGL